MFKRLSVQSFQGLSFLLLTGSSDPYEARSLQFDVIGYCPDGITCQGIKNPFALRNLENKRLAGLLAERIQLVLRAGLWQSREKI